ncbi:Hypothetical_protein [Hexamita inflata]|uniref:Hypothetical_protein n=1 Tax=Hexamita inflata TaxID=28002 RepID=A0ABP1IKB2_9EUKA
MSEQLTRTFEENHQNTIICSLVVMLLARDLFKCKLTPVSENCNHRWFINCEKQQKNQDHSKTDSPIEYICKYDDSFAPGCYGYSITLKIIVTQLSHVLNSIIENVQIELKLI